MPVAIPTSLPLPLVAGYSIEPYDQTSRTPMESGAGRVRGRNLAFPYKVGLQWLFTDAQLDTFEDWRGDDIDQGADEFTLQLLGSEGLETVTARFLETYKVSRNQTRWLVQASLEVSDFAELTEAQYLYLIGEEPLSITLSVASISQDAGYLGPATLTSAQVTSTTSGGAAPYTYAWTKVSGFDFTLNESLTGTTQIFQTSEATATREAVYRLTVTDYFGNTATDDVSLTHIWPAIEWATWDSGGAFLGNITLSNGNMTAAFAAYNGTETVWSNFKIRGAEALVKCFELEIDAVSNPNGTTSQQNGIGPAVASAPSATTAIRHESFNGYSKLRIGSAATTGAASDTDVAAPAVNDVWGFVFDMNASPPNIQCYLNGVATGPARTLANAYTANDAAGVWIFGSRGTVTGSNTMTITLRTRPSEMTHFDDYGATAGFHRNI